MADSKDTSRTAVRTYVPAYQKSVWKEHADELDMSQSEFVRTMVQAGRRKFAFPSSEAQPDSPETQQGATSLNSSARTEISLDERVLAALEADEYTSWDQLRESLIGDFEDQLEDVLSRLQDENRIRYSGRHSGYTALTNDE